MVSHVCLGFLQCRLRGSSALCGDLKGPTHGAKETAHLRDIWHDLTVFYRCVELPQKRVVFSQFLVDRNLRWNAGWLCMIHSGESLFGKRVALHKFLDQILVWT